MHFVDTNVFLRFLTKDDPEKAEKCRELLQAASQGSTKLYTTDLVFAELIWVLQSPRTYNLSPSEISDLVIPLATIKGLSFPAKRYLPDMMELFVSTGADFIDVYNAVMMQIKGIGAIYSYDSDFDLFKDVTRVVPE